jgi:hypothetical protein
MKRIIKLTESDLTRIVKRTIMELDRSTYERAAKVAGKKGFSKLADKFTSHGKEFGLNQDRDTITMIVKRQGEKPYTVRILDLSSPKEGYYQNAFELTTEDVETGDKRKFMINKFTDAIEFYLSGDYPAIPETRKDARKILKRFESAGADVSNIDPRSISYEDTGL